MRTALLAGLALAAPVAAQFQSARPLIAAEDSHPVAGIPLDGIWSTQFYLGPGNEFIEPVDGVWLDVVEHEWVRWDEERRVYRGLGGFTWRVLPLTGKRLLFERDLDFGGETWARILEWSDGDLHLFELETEPGSAFARRMRDHGVELVEREERGLFGDTSRAWTVSGSPEAVVAALRELPLEGTPSRRWRRPKHDEMGYLWNWFEVQRWVDQQRGVLSEIESVEDRLQALGGLHQARWFARQATHADLANIGSLELDGFNFGRWRDSDFKALHERSTALVKRLDERIEERMTWVASQVSVVEHVEQPDDPEDPWDFVHRPGPGALLRFHMVVTDESGRELENTLAKGEPVVAPVMGDLPEGIQWALRTIGYEEQITLNLPPQLAFGPQFGTVRVELQIVEGLSSAPPKPPVEGLLSYSIGPVESEETPSGLRYRTLREGEGDSPRRGQEVRIRTVSWNVAGKEVRGESVDVVEVGAGMPGVDEALLAMKIGGQRVLFVPRHLAESRGPRAGMAQCVVVELIEIVE